MDIKKYIKNAQGIIITAGAGMGVDSGLPDFRGVDGFWRAYPAIKKLGLNFSQMANPKWFDTNPKLAWAFYGHRLNLYKNTTPHNGFKILFEYAKKLNNYFVVTSNVDGQFQKAGFLEDNIYEIHGSIHYFQCKDNCTDNLWEAEDVSVDMEEFKALNIPKCKYCQNTARVNILMFNDWYFNPKRTNKQEANFNKWLKANRNKKIVIIEIGAGLAIPSIRLIGEELARKYKFFLIRINPRDYQIDSKFGVSIKKGGLEGIKEIFSEI